MHKSKTLCVRQQSRSYTFMLPIGNGCSHIYSCQLTFEDDLCVYKHVNTRLWLQLAQLIVKSSKFH